MTQRACSNPLCEHYYRMVGNDHEFFAFQLQVPVPPVPTERDISTDSVDILGQRLGRNLYRWTIAEEDRYRDQMPWVAKWVWTYSYEVNCEVLTEWYYFCDGCHLVLKNSRSRL